jgi:hypothetical protein
LNKRQWQRKYEYPMLLTESKWYSIFRKAKWTVMGFLHPVSPFSLHGEARKLSQDLTDEYERQNLPVDTVGTAAPSMKGLPLCSVVFNKSPATGRGNV